MYINFNRKTLNYFVVNFCLFAVVSCGGGGGGGAGSTPSSTPTPEPTAVPETWRVSGNVGNAYIMLSDYVEADYQEIYAFNPLDDTYVRLSREMPSGGKVAKISVSPDKQKVAYLADQDAADRFELFVANADGSANIKASFNISIGYVSSFTWSHDSERLMFVHSVNDNQRDYYIVDVDGGNLRYLTRRFNYPNTFSWGSTNDQMLISENGYNFGVYSTSDLDESLFSDGFSQGIDSLSWSNSGEYVAYLSERSQSDEMVDDMLRISYISSSESDSYLINQRSFSPSWSPSSNELVVWSIQDTEFYELYKINAETANVTQLTDSSLRDLSYIREYKWSRNGEYFVFEANRRTNTADLYAVRVDDSAEILYADIIPGMGELDSHSLSDDDLLLIESLSGTEGRISDFFITSLDGSNIVDISDDVGLPNRIYSHKWSASGDAILLHHYDSVTQERLLNEHNLTTKETRIISAVPNETREVICYVVGSVYGSTCRLAFDFR